jgi:hypothetical protein
MTGCAIMTKNTPALGFCGFTEEFKNELITVTETRHWIDNQIYESRAKDYRNPFKIATYRNTVEMEEVLGKPSDNSFICLIRKESANFSEMIEKVSARL